MKVRILFFLCLLFGGQLLYAESSHRIPSTVSNPFHDKAVIHVIEIERDLYLQSFSSQFDGWIGNSPVINGDFVPYYADDEKFPVALEWKISCRNKIDCGRIIVSVDKEDPVVLESATYGKANYEVLGHNREHIANRFYYFSPFEQYVDSSLEQIEQVVALSPGEKGIGRIEISAKKDKNRKDKQNIKVKNRSGVSLTGSTVANVPSLNNGTTCTSPIPCYNQFNATYNGISCAVGCGPTALTQILAYHDRRGTFPNLFAGVASATTINQTVANTIRTYMGTVCSNGEGATGFSSEGNGMRYARDMGYSNTTIPSLITTNIFYNIRLNVNNGRPMIINASSASAGHIFVAYGWNTDIVGKNQIHVNYGWGSGTPDAWITESSIPALPNMVVRSILPVVVRL